MSIKDEIKKELAQYQVRLHSKLLNNENYRMFKYHRSLRYSEYYDSMRKNGGLQGGAYFILYLLWRKRLNKNSIVTGFSVGLHTCDWGLRFMHTGPIIINEYAKIGKNCQLYPQILVGQTDKGKSPVIGDNVVICSGAKIVEPVEIGNNCIIAANALIVKSVPSNSLMVSQLAIKKK